MSKIFVLGYNKTGTKSLAKSLEILGYKNIQTYHMNEGHCSFLTLALLEKFSGDEKKVRSFS